MTVGSIEHAVDSNLQCAYRVVQIREFCVIGVSPILGMSDVCEFSLQMPMRFDRRFLETGINRLLLESSELLKIKNIFWRNYCRYIKLTELYLCQLCIVEQTIKQLVEES